MEEEMYALQWNHTQYLIPKPKDALVASCPWIFTIVHNLDCTFDGLESYLMAKRFTWNYGLDCTKSFSPMAKLNFLLVFISIVANLDWLFANLI